MSKPTDVNQLYAEHRNDRSGDLRRKRKVTVRLEVNGTDEQLLSHWIWENHKQYLLQGDKAPTAHECLVTGIYDDDLIRKNRELEERIADYEKELGLLRDAIEGEDDEDISDSGRTEG
jgi:hypothetical protein